MCIHRDECVCVVSVSDVLCNSQKKCIRVWCVAALLLLPRGLLWYIIPLNGSTVVLSVLYYG
jgi:hypothetical protein